MNDRPRWARARVLLLILALAVCAVVVFRLVARSPSVSPLVEKPTEQRGIATAPPASASAASTTRRAGCVCDPGDPLCRCP